MDDQEISPEVRDYMASLGRKGGKKGGKIGGKARGPQKVASAKKASFARWSKWYADRGMVYIPVKDRDNEGDMDA